MELCRIEGLYRNSWQSQPMDAWSDTLKSVCGRFNPTPERGVSKVTGLVEGMRAGGIDFAHVAYDLARVSRGRLDILRDDSEALFLVIQLSGTAGIEHNGCRVSLVPGDCILIDSRRPVTFRQDRF